MIIQVYRYNCTIVVDDTGLETACIRDLGSCADSPTYQDVVDLATGAIDFKPEFVKAFTNMIEYVSAYTSSVVYIAVVRGLRPIVRPSAHVLKYV